MSQHLNGLPRQQCEATPRRSSASVLATRLDVVWCKTTKQQLNGSPKQQRRVTPARNATSRRSTHTRAECSIVWERSEQEQESVSYSTPHSFLHSHSLLHSL